MDYSHSKYLIIYRDKKANCGIAAQMIESVFIT